MPPEPLDSYASMLMVSVGVTIVVRPSSFVHLEGPWAPGLSSCVSWHESVEA